MAAATASSSNFFSTLGATTTTTTVTGVTRLSLPPNSPLTSSLRRRRSPKIGGIYATISTAPTSSKPDDLVATIFHKVVQTDRGVSLTRDEHRKVAEVAQELQKFCVDEPAKCPLIFGEWDVVYCSVPTSPGGGYRSAVGRLFFRTKDMIQVIEAPDIVKNRVSFSALGFLDGEVSLQGSCLVKFGII
ncbi:hypothetical protein RJ639_022603 [Escallonia herrerae]|uniref:Plastid lipid-associated protein/fibrillin conserved domain-containing protein n=1 Tax=Escallonia herrerae TaxID=1293975 RepID=A0AA89ABW2_9ASTE|nr:hypothetical protein RJ639_022603 [Escallonia herrerae]